MGPNSRDDRDPAKTGQNPDLARPYDRANGTVSAGDVVAFGGTLKTEIVNPEINLVLQGRQSTEQALKKIERAMTSRILKPVNEAEAAERTR